MAIPPDPDNTPDCDEPATSFSVSDSYCGQLTPKEPLAADDSVRVVDDSDPEWEYSGR